MRFIPVIARILLGLIFTVFGLNFFLHFIPMQGPQPPALVNFATALGGTYVMTIVKVIEVSSGILLLVNRFVPLALTLLAPIIVNIVAVHTLMAPSGLPVAIVILLLELYLAYVYRGAFLPMLRAKVTPNAAAA